MIDLTNPPSGPAITAARPLAVPGAYHEKVWGRTRCGMRLGEIWFRLRPLLLKFIFTSEKLSVQVHPGDEYAARHDHSLGKTECWYVMDTEPGARLAVGLRQPLSTAELRAAVNDGSIEKELNWLEVRSGDFVFVPWGTVHAIGAGLTLCEIQEFSDMTYRLYDYGRPRELHLEKAMDVVRQHPAAGRRVGVAARGVAPAEASTGGEAAVAGGRTGTGPRPESATGTTGGAAGIVHEFLVGCRYFAVERLATPREYHTAVESDGFEVLVFLKGEGAITGRDFFGRYGEEQMWRLPGRMGEYRIVPERETAWLRVYAPPSLDDFRERLRRAGLAADEVKRVVVDDL